MSMSVMEITYVTTIVLIQLGPIHAHVIQGMSWNQITGLVKVFDMLYGVICMLIKLLLYRQ